MKLDYSARLHNVIPGGAHTYSRGDDQFPSNAPKILERGKGAYVWDPSGTRYLDYGMALRAVTLGYGNSRINKAAYDAIEKGVNLTRATTLELEAAESFVNQIPSVDMVKFAKNGSNVTTAALKIARAYTGRRYICVPKQQPFFSFDDWFIGKTNMNKGVLPEYSINTLLFDYGDIESLKKLFKAHSEDIAAVMLEPATTSLPCITGCKQNDPITRSTYCCSPNFLNQVEDVCKSEGALFILDEMITGFRWHLQGAQKYFDVNPDLSTFGKAMGNGFSVSAIAGKREFMKVGSIKNTGAERTFLLSTTHGAEMPGLAAYLEIIKIYKEKDVINHLWNYGKCLFDGIREIAKNHGIQSHFTMEGSAISMNYVTRDKDSKVSNAFRTLFSQEMIKSGILMPWIAISFAHRDEELDLTLKAVNKALSVYSRALEGGIEKFLDGHTIKPVFRKEN
jgi:glutamate-1-semialdehyde 2,1-aminomutase